MNRTLVILSFIALLFACGQTPKKADDATVEKEVIAVEQRQEILSPEEEQAIAEPYAARSILRADRSTLPGSQDIQNFDELDTIVYFEYDSSTIKAEDIVIVEGHVQHMLNHPNVIVTLSGHADERGSREYNLALGQRRAQSIKRQMTLLGVSANRISVISLGEEKPLVNEHNEHAWSRNRRVEFIY